MLRAIPYNIRATFLEEAAKGSFRIADEQVGAPAHLWFFCPCGCGALSSIRIGERVKPAPEPSWSWNGNRTSPTLEPSVRQLNCGWHGWLRDGYWESC